MDIKWTTPRPYLQQQALEAKRNVNLKSEEVSKS